MFAVYCPCFFILLSCRYPYFLRFSSVSSLQLCIQLSFHFNNDLCLFLFPLLINLVNSFRECFVFEFYMCVHVSWFHVCYCCGCCCSYLRFGRETNYRKSELIIKTKCYLCSIISYRVEFICVLCLHKDYDLQRSGYI